uniref:hypothetical protein n=1 Tax=Marinobacterium profundum TaxID=1714300 RepID=UPI00083755DC|nr:hypothetical protein [Marinobacterium profundum]
MTQPRQYRFNHITDLAQLADEDIAEFCRELPNTIRQMQQTFVVLDELATGTVDRRRTMPVLEWEPLGVECPALDQYSQW